MDGLRWLLLLFGVLVIAGVYLYSRRERNKPDENIDVENHILPAIGETSAESDVDVGEQAESPAQDLPQKIVTLRVVARDRGAFHGEDLVLSLRGIGMRHGKFGIFHRIEGSDEDKTIFSAASLVEPGSFDLANIQEQVIPGISLFLVIPGPIDGAEAFDMMMAAARTLAQSMNAELLDESGSTLSIQRERYMREEIIDFQHSNLVA